MFLFPDLQWLCYTWLRHKELSSDEHCKKRRWLFYQLEREGNLGNSFLFILLQISFVFWSEKKKTKGHLKPALFFCSIFISWHKAGQFIALTDSSWSSAPTATITVWNIGFKMVMGSFAVILNGTEPKTKIPAPLNSSCSKFRSISKSYRSGPSTLNLPRLLLAQHFVLAVFTIPHVAATINYAAGNAIACEVIDLCRDSDLSHMALLQPHAGQDSTAPAKGTRAGSPTLSHVSKSGLFSKRCLPPVR